MQDDNMSVTDLPGAISDSVTESAGLVISFLPTVLGALLLVILGFVLARLVAAGTTRLLQLIGIDRLLGRTAFQTLL